MVVYYFKYPGTHDIGLPTRVTSKRCGHRQAAIATNCLGERLYQSDKIGLVVIICGITVHAAGLGRKQGYQPTRACPRFGPRRGFICLDSCSLRTKSCVVDLPYSGAQATSRRVTSCDERCSHIAWRVGVQSSRTRPMRISRAPA